MGTNAPAAPRDQICIGFHSFGQCQTQFAVSLSGAVRYEGSRLSSIIHVPSPYVTEARNKIVRRFLVKTKANHLLMMDVDLEFPEDAISRTYLEMKKIKAEVMFGCYALGDFRPSIFGPPQNEDKALPTVTFDLENANTYQIYAGSTGWLLATREALLKIEAANIGRHWPWFDHDIESADDLRDGELYKGENNTIRIGEDFSFSKRAREAGITLYGTTAPLLIHDKIQPLLPEFQAETAREAGLAIKEAGAKGSECQATPKDKDDSWEPSLPASEPAKELAQECRKSSLENSLPNPSER